MTHHDSERATEMDAGDEPAVVGAEGLMQSYIDVADDDPLGNAGLPGASAKLVGSVVDERYEIEAVLGEGGMGVVYAARHVVIGKRVALKSLRGAFSQNAEVAERFLIEAKAASRIDDPHIIDILDFGRLPTGGAYFVMEFLEGEPLSAFTAGRQTLSPERVVGIAKQLAEGLAAAHRSDIVHRDLKPDNVFLTTRGGERDFVKILDFGIAKVMTQATNAKLTRAGAVFGTPHYMSPEQAGGKPVDARTDIYACGVILYELLAGRVPFDADTFMGILTQHLYKEPTPFRLLEGDATPSVPPGLEAIVLKCLSKRAEERYSSMDELAVDLCRYERGEEPRAVADMAGRSSSYEMPEDYFRTPPPSAATNSRGAGADAGRRRRGLLTALVAGSVLAGLALVAALGGGANDKSSDAVAATAREATPPAATARSVAVATSPLSAHVFLHGKDLGTSPVTLDVPDGARLPLVVRAEGYAEKTVELDGSRASVAITLDALAATPAVSPKPQPSTTHPRLPAVRTGRAAQPTVTVAGPEPVVPKPPAPKKKPDVSGGEILDPWAND